MGVTFVALLRGVNIGGKQVAMAQLRRGLEDLGLRRADLPAERERSL